jgi:hypothetical protein
MNLINSMDVTMASHKLQTARANRIAWMVDEMERSRANTIGARARQLVLRLGGVAAALVALLLAGTAR